MSKVQDCVSTAARFTDEEASRFMDAVAEQAKAAGISENQAALMLAKDRLSWLKGSRNDLVAAAREAQPSRWEEENGKPASEVASPDVRQQGDQPAGDAGDQRSAQDTGKDGGSAGGNVASDGENAPVPDEASKPAPGVAESAEKAPASDLENPPTLTVEDEAGAAPEAQGADEVSESKTKETGQGVAPLSRKALEQGYISESQWQEMRDGVRRTGLDRQGQEGQEQRGTAGAGEGDPARLQRFYHGTQDTISPGFDLNHPNRKDAGWLGEGVYVTDDPDLAETYSKLKAGSGDPNVLPLAIKIRNPFIADLGDKRRLSRMSKDGVKEFTASLIRQGHDGVVLTYANGTSEVVVFDPKAVRSYHAEFKPGSNPTGDLLYSRGTGSGGATARVQATADRIAKAWPNAPKIVVIESMADAPEGVQANDAAQRSGGATGDPEGFYHEGKVYLVAGALEADADVERVIAHEVLGHAGLRGAFGIKALSNILGQVAVVRPAAIKAKLTEYGLKDTPAMRLVAAEEVLAELAQTQPEIGFVRRAVAAIRTWLREHGIGLKLTRDEIIRNYILPARKWVQGQGKSATGSPVPAFSREDDVFVNEALAELAQHDDLFRYSASKKTTLDGVMAEVFSQAKYLGEDTRPDEREESGADVRHVFQTALGKNFYIFERGKDVWADISRLEEGEHGGGIYAAILNYTHNAKKVLIGDPAGLSEAAVIRRTSAMLSSALRFGTTAHMDAAAEQRAGDPAKGIAPLKWQGDDVQKTSALIETFLSTLYTQMPALKGYRYDFRTRKFLDRSGRPLGPDRFADASRLGISRSARVGEATARRGIFLKSLVSSEGSARPGLLEQVLRRGSSLAAGDLRGMFSRKKTVEQARETFADMMQSTKAFNWWNKSIGTQYEKAQKNPAFRAVYNRVQEYIQDIADFGSRAAEQAPTLLPRLDKISDAFKKPVSAADQKAISAALYGGTLAGESVTEGRVWTDDELRSTYKLTDPQIALYREARAAIDKSMDDLGRTEIVKLVGDSAGTAGRQALAADSMAEASEILQSGLDEQIDQLREDESDENKRKIEHLQSLKRSVRAQAKRMAELREAGYMPLMRFGKYAVNVVDPDVEGESLHFALFDTEREANAHARELRQDSRFANSEITQGIISDRAAQLMQGVDPATLEIFAEAIGASESEVFQEYLKLVTTQRSALKRLIERKGTPGYSEDVKRTLASFITSNARAASGNLHLRDLLLNTSKIKEGDVKDEAIGLVKHVLDPMPDPSAKARSLLFMQFIGGSVASALVNMTQPVTMTLPYLSQFSNPARAANLLRKAMVSAVRGVTGEEADALKRAERDGIVSPQEIHFLYGEAEKAFGSNPLLQRAGYLWGAPFGLAEQFNRRATFLAAYRLAIELKNPSPFAFAEKAVVETQGVYNRGNAANWARNPVGGALLVFKQFSVAYLEFLKRLPNRERAVALAILALASGMEGLPGADDLDDILDTFAQALGYNWSSKAAKREFITSTLGPEMSQFLTRGSSAFLPIDISARMGMGNLLPGTGLLMQSRQDKGREVSEVFGAPGGAVQMVGKAASRALEGNLGAAATAVMPVALQNILDPNRGAMAMAMAGQYKDDRGRKVVDVDAFDALMKGAGFNPSAVAEPQLATRIAKQSIDFARVVEAEIAGDLAAARVQGDPDRAQAAKERLADWNAKNPETPIRIQESQIRRRAREMQTTKTDRLVRSAPKDLRDSVRRQLEPVEE